MKRIAAIKNRHRLVVAADRVKERAEHAAAQCSGAVSTDDWESAVSHPAVEAVIVATTNEALAAITEKAVNHGKHVLVEKPAGRTPFEIDAVIAAAKKFSVCVKVGFNHRFHPSFIKARKIVDSDALGSLMFIRGRYGHGGRIGYEKEWRARPELSGGGELIDQGVHLIDLSRWFLGEFNRVEGCCRTFYWDMPVEDNGFVRLETPHNQIAWLHVSCTEWKNMFSFEIYGEKGKLQIDGLGGSYGTERLAYYKMLPRMGPPETTIWEFPGNDVSWQTEIESFIRDVKCLNRNDSCESFPYTPNLNDARAGLAIVDGIYRSQKAHEKG